MASRLRPWTAPPARAGGRALAERVILPDPAGFDLYSPRDCERWRVEAGNGFNDRWNYGARSFTSDAATSDLYLRTANPFYGCQVWRKRAIR